MRLRSPQLRHHPRVFQHLPGLTVSAFYTLVAYLLPASAGSDTCNGDCGGLAP